MTELAATKTTFTPQELLAALATAWRSEMGGEPSHASLAVLAAQVALETANGKACVQNNVGNFKAYAGVDSCSFLTTEWIGTPPAPVSMTCKFAAWPTLAEGVQAYLRNLYTHWTKAWHFVCAGDPEGFSAGLRAQGYYTAPVELYAKGVRRWFTFYAALLGGDPAPTEPELPAAGVFADEEREGLIGPPDEVA